MSRSLIRARRLEAGVTVGLVAPSSPVPVDCLHGTVAYLRGRGYEVKLGNRIGNALGGFLAGTDEERAADINEMIADPQVRMIVPAMGGKGSSHLLPLLDYQGLVADPKILMGLSDPSLLMLAIHARTGLVTFHGPTGMEFGQLGVTPYTDTWMRRALEVPRPLGIIDAERPRETIRGGDPVEGRLLGGHLGTIRALIGTPYEPDWDGALLFFEEIDTEYHDVDAGLSHLRLAGVLDRIAGLILGSCVNVEERYWPSEERLADVVLRACQRHRFPILGGVDLGHTPDKATLPLGVRARLDADRGELAILEAGVE